MRCALLGLALIACATTRTDKLDVQGESGSLREVVKSETHDEAPSVVVVEEYAAPAPQDMPPGVQPNGPVRERPESSSGERSSGGAPLPILLKRTTITTGAVHDEQHVNAEGQSHSDTHAQAASTSTATPKLPTIPLSCGLAGGVWIYVAVAVALGGGGLGLTRVWVWVKTRMTRP